MSASAVQDVEANRLGLALCIAIALHAVGMAVSFSLPASHEPPPSLEITLARSRSDAPPAEADFLAQHNQQGSGQLAQKSRISTDRPSRVIAPDVSDSAIPEIAAAALSVPAQREELRSRASSPRKSSEQPPAERAADTAGPHTRTRLDQEIASLEAEIDRERRQNARMPRTHRLTSLSTRESADAGYLYDWQRRIEQVGNQHYPEAAARRQLDADLRMLVALRPNGTIAEIRVLQSSGHPELDQAAIRIVRIAAPFQPLSREMRAKYDRLEIIRTWQFRHNRFSGH